MTIMADSGGVPVSAKHDNEFEDRGDSLAIRRNTGRSPDRLNPDGYSPAVAAKPFHGTAQ